uniref:G protein signaling modulator 1a n=1 Tax=Amphiprion percula TaxID=161767 RepID=A0A3P8U5T4_AMPPE
MAEEELLESLVITEDRDTTETDAEKEAASCSNAVVQSCSEESAPKEKEKQTGEYDNPEDTASKLNLKEQIVFSSMTSLQKEEFFELVATAQARRLDDQRAHIKQLSFVKKPAPVPVPKEDLYNMILTTQGRLEDQRSRAPGPMDDEDFFSLLLRVQGGRMDEQRTELPRLLQT